MFMEKESTAVLSKNKTILETWEEGKQKNKVQSYCVL